MQSMFAIKCKHFGKQKKSETESKGIRPNQRLGQPCELAVRVTQFAGQPCELAVRPCNTINSHGWGQPCE